MSFYKCVSIVFLLGTSPLFAQPATQYKSPKADLIKQFKLNICEANAEKAREITRATIKAKTFNATPEVIAQTIAGSPERELMMHLFEPEGLIASVLIRSASFGARMIPSEGNKGRSDIDEFAFEYVRNKCNFATMVN